MPETTQKEEKQCNPSKMPCRELNERKTSYLVTLKCPAEILQFSNYTKLVVAICILAVVWLYPGCSLGFSCACVRVPWFRVLRTADTLADWLRRRPAKPMGFSRAGSNPTGVGSQFAGLRRFDSAKVDVQKRGCSGN